MKKTIVLLIAGLVLIGLNAFGQNDVYIGSSGNMEIGATNPDGKLEVQGEINKDGVIGSSSGTGAGIYGEHTTGTFGYLGYFDAGVMGYSPSGYGVYGYTAGSGYAGYFLGDARVTGDLIVDGILNATISETDPVFSGSTAFGISSGQLINWDTAFGWGDHSAAGYINSESDPTVNSLAKTVLSCSQDQIVKWDGSAWICTTPVPVCNPGDSLTCYTGPIGTKNVGSCQFGYRDCMPDSLWSDCLNQIVPSTEICGDGIDQDCDGLLDCDDPDCFADPVCTVITCNGIAQSDPSVCSGNGTCVAQDTCTCTAGYTGTNCEQPLSGSIIITEVMVDSSAVSDIVGEWFEVYNTIASPVNMNSWVINDLGTDTFTINAPGGLIVPPGSFAVLCKNSDFATNGGVICDYEYSNFILGNSNDEIVLTFDSFEVDRVSYSGSWPFSIGTTMELSGNHFDYTQNDNSANWCSATSPYGSGDLGTPGAMNNCAK